MGDHLVQPTGRQYSDSAIVTQGLSKRFGERLAVDNLNLVVQPGEIFGLLGPNGAGKTTTIAMLLGLLRPSAGQAWLLGHNIQTQLSQALAEVGALIESAAFYPYLSARDNLRVLARGDGLPEKRVDQALELVELRSRANDRFQTLSQGMRQRLALAAALLHNPRLVLLDEPSNGLDPAGQQAIRALIRSMAADGRTMLVSGHQLHEIEQLCTRVAIMKQGRIIAQGHVAELLSGRVFVRVVGNPAHAEALLRRADWVREVQPFEQGLLIETQPERIAEISTLLSAQGFALAEMRPQSLEEVFLRLTQ